MPVFGTCAGHDPARRRRARRPARPALASAPSTSPCAATPTAARSTASRPTSTSAGLDGAVPRRVHPRARGRARRCRRRGAGPRTTGAPVLARQGHVTVAVVPSRAGRATSRLPRPLPRRRSDVLMSGHSKWATIKHKKGAEDKARGKLFAKLIRQIEVAAREGGGDLDANATLRTMVPEGARRRRCPTTPSSAPSSAAPASSRASPTSRSPTRATRPGGVALLIDVLTDNRNRTGAEVRSVFSQASAARWPSRARWRGSSAGAGVILVAASGRRGRRDAGRPRRRRRRHRRRRRRRGASPPSRGAVEAVREALEAAGVEVTSAESTDGRLDHRRAARPTPTRPRRCCGSWTPSRTTTTCRTSTRTSTSPTTILAAVEA